MLSRVRMKGQEALRAAMIQAAAVVVVNLVAASLAVGETGESQLWSWKACRERGLERLEAGDHREARRLLLLATVLHPRHEPSRRSLEDAERRLEAQLLRDGQSLISKGDERTAVRTLIEAALLRGADDGEAGRLLQKLGSRRYGEEWLGRDELVLREKAEERRARVRRAELELKDDFVLDRRADVRIFTDHSTGDVLPFTRRLHRLVLSARRAHARLFLPLTAPADRPDGGRAGLESGIDIVVFKRREDYIQLTGSTSTVGMFLPDRGVSVFFLGERPSGVDPAVLLHELCHQLDLKALGMRWPAPWLSEGLAVYFEGARVTPEWEIESLGLLPAGGASRLAAIASERGERWWGIERLCAVADVRPLHATDAVHDFYAQAALVIQTLLWGPPERRALFFDLVERARAPGARPDSAWRDFTEAAAAHGVGLDELLPKASSGGGGRAGE